MLERMIDKRPQADRLLIAELCGEARRRAQWRELSSEEEAAAVAELRKLAGGRADLLAEVAGILEGAREGELDEPLARQAAKLCRAAGADPEAIPAWIAEGRRRRASAKKPPFSGGLHGGGAQLDVNAVSGVISPLIRPSDGHLLGNSPGAADALTAFRTLLGAGRLGKPLRVPSSFDSLS